MKKFFSLILMAIILNFSVVSAEETVQPEVQEIFDEVKKLAENTELAKKNLDLIDKLTYKIPQQYPDDKIVLKKLYYVLGRAYAIAEKYDFAKKYLTLSYQIDSNNPDVYFQFGYVESNLKNYDQSTKYYEKSLELETNNEDKAWCENNIGADYYFKKDFQSAIKHYTASINYFPRAFTYRNRGDIFADEMKDYSTAIMDFNKVIELDAKYLDAYWSRAAAYYNLKNYSAALKDYKKVLELDATKNQVLFWIGYCYSELKNHSAAVESYTKYLYYFPEDKWAYNNRGWDCENIGDYATAIANYTQAILIDSSEGKFYRNRGRVYKKLGKTEQAEQDFKKARELGLN